MHKQDFRYFFYFCGLSLFLSCGGWHSVTRSDLTVRSTGRTTANRQQADAVNSPQGSQTSAGSNGSGEETPVPPPAQTAPMSPLPKPAQLKAKPGPVVGSVELTLEPGDENSWQRLLVRRMFGTTAPDCSQGVVAWEFLTPPSAAETFVDLTSSAGAVVTYSACFVGKDGSSGRLTYSPSATTKHQIMFTTSPTLTGNLGGSASAADDLCIPFATRSPKLHLRSEKYWRAILSDSRVSAKTRVRILGPVVAADFSLTQTFHTLFRDADSFWSTGLTADSGAVLDATGNPTQSPVWTGSNERGLVSTGLTCNDWRSTSSGEFGMSGDASTLLGYGWLNGGGPGSCNEQRALYCIAEPPPMITATPSKGSNGGIDLALEPPLQAQSTGSIVIRRRAAAAGLPSLTCDSPFDTPIQTINPITGSTNFVDTLVAPGTAYHYSACLLDEFGNLVHSTRAVHVVAAAPTPP